MGLDITVLIADWSWLGEVPTRERLPRLRDAWYADETGLWDVRPEAARTVEGDWDWPRGTGGPLFGIYEFRGTLGSFKAHFWAGERWEAVREHADPVLRTEVDALLLGLVWNGLDGEAEHTDPEFFADPGLPRDDPAVPHGVLLARSPDSVRRLAATWERARPLLGGLREAFGALSTVPHGGGWVRAFDEFAVLLEDWGRVLAEADRRGWCVVGLSE
ncbi:hypothetical protein ACFWZT_36940 [Streptomyces alboflavus]|uniref:hypothetical protein n=1 Tax=Streptomyces alboflavus TaxID=67267 RepID=UPI0036A65CB6